MMWKTTELVDEHKLKAPEALNKTGRNSARLKGKIDARSKNPR